jgi:hypothetical protein
MQQAVAQEPPTEPMSANQSETGRLKRLRARQMRRDSRARAAQAQKAAAEIAERTGRYILWSIALAAVSAAITAAAVGYAVISDLVRTIPQ